MNPSSVLSPEIADLGLAVGLLHESDGTLAFDSDWFSNPGPKVSKALADEDRRAALIRFVDAVNGGSDGAHSGGIQLLKLFDATELGIADAPALVVNLSVDDRNAAYVEVGLSVSFTTETPRTQTDLVVPLYRTGKMAGETVQPVAEHFAMAAGSPIRLATSLTLGDGTPDVSGFGLRSVDIAVGVPLTGAGPTIELSLLGLVLPGATTATDIHIGGPDSTIEEALLSLVLGVVQAAARSLGSAGAAALAALDLIGLGPNPNLPPLDVNAIAQHGVSALRDWFATTLAEPARLDAWLQSLHAVVGGTVSSGELRVPLGGGPVDLILAVASVPGSGGHLKVTPRVGLELHQLLGAGSTAVRIAARAEVDVMTVDLADGSLTALPAAELFVEAAGDGVRLLPAGPVQIGSAHLGVALQAGSVVPMIRLLDVQVQGGSTHDVVDLSSADAVVAAAGSFADGLLETALDGFAAGAHLKVLLGLVETGGSGKIDAGKLLVDPLGALSEWWHLLVTTHSADVPAVLGHLRDLIAVDAFVDIGGHAALAVGGDGSPEHPWSIPVIDRVTIDVWHVGEVLTMAVNLGFRVDDLAGGCTVVEVDARAELITIDFAGHHASLLHAVELNAGMRGRGVPQTRLGLGPVAVVVDSIGVLARWTAAQGFAVGLATPGLAAEVDGLSVPLALPIGADWTTSVFVDVENFIGLLGASQPHGWLHTLTDLFGWTIGGTVVPHRLSLAALSTDAPTELRVWAKGVIASGEVIDELAPRLATLLTGTNDGIGGGISGRGSPDNPWVLPLSSAENGFAIDVALGPSGPKLSPTLVSNALSSWRPGDPGLPSAGLAGAMLAESGAGADVAALMHGRRSTLAGGWADLVARVSGTDVLVAPPLTPPSGVEVISHPGRNFLDWPTVGVPEALGGPAPVAAAVVRVAIGTATDNPWTDQPADRQIDLSAPGLTPESFTVNSPAAGEWFVVLGTRTVTSLGVTDPTGVLGQAARLSRIVAALGNGRPVVIVAVGGAGHAARLAADLQPSVTDLVTLGTPWGPVAFDSARNGSSADGLRLLAALIPSVDTTDPDDADLALGRVIVEGLGDTAGQSNIEAPRPTVTVRAGLRVRAWFGNLDQLTVERAFTAIVAAGLSLRARRRADGALAAPTSAQVSVRVPLSAALPSSGHGVVVDGYVNVGLIGSDFATANIKVANRVALHLTVSDTDAWLVGGPGTVPAGGAGALELRFFDLDIDIGLGGNAADSAASVTLHEVSALGAYRDRIVVSPPAPGATTGTIETLPFLPEARAAIAALIVQLRSIDPTAPGAHLLALLDGIGLSTSTGLVPDALTHLLHDPSGFVTAALSSSGGRAAIATALSRLVDSATVAGDVVTITRSGASVAVDLGNRSAAVHATGSGALPWAIDLEGLGHGAPTGAVTVGSASFNGGAARFGLAPFTVSLERLTATGAARSAAVWPSPDANALADFALAALPAEAIRLVLTAVRTLDADVAVAIDALTDALGALGPANANGIRPILAPIGLFDDPGGWFRHHALGNGSSLDVDRVINLFEALKPFVGVTDPTRGHWPIIGGVDLTVTAGGGGPTVAIALDPSVWLTNGARPPVAMGVSLGLTLAPNGAPTPAVELFAGVPTDPPTVDHRSAAHVVVDAGGLRVFLRSGTGSDIGLYPNAAGLGQLLSSGVDLLLPKVLDALAALDGSTTRTQVAELTTAIGRGLDLLNQPVATPPTFSGAQLRLLANDPAKWLEDHIGTLVTNAVAALDPLIHQLPGAPTAVLNGANLVVTVRTVSLTFNPTPLTVSIAGSVTGIPIIGGAAASFSANASGLTAWDFGVGPATFDLGGPKIRPLLRAGRADGQGWEAAIGLALDDIAATTAGHKELFGRWREADGLAIVARTRGASTDTDAIDAPTVALFAADAVVELLGNYIIEITEVAAMLDKSVNGNSVRIILQGSILSDADSHKLRAAPVSALPGSLFVLARKLATALPPLPLGPLSLSLAETHPNVYGVRLDVIDHDKGLELTQGGDIAISLVTDASWIEPPVPPPPQPGIIVDIVSISNDPTPVFAPSPGIAANGVGVRIAKRSGPLLDAGLRLDSVAVHLFGSLQPGIGSVAVSGGVHLALEGLGVPLGAGGGDNAVAKGVMSDAGGSGGPPTPKFSPAIAVQAHHGVTGVAVSLSAGPGDGPWYMPIQRAFGPLYLEQIGFGTGYLPTAPRQLDFIAISLDGSVSLFGITASVDKLRLTYHVNQPFFDANSWAIDLDGFAISANMGGLTLVGALLKAPLAPPLVGMEYLGMLKIGFNGYGIDLFGGYAHPTDGQGDFASFFAFGALHAPLGGVPAFFITGIGLGLGINRELKPPTMDTITSNPFLAAMKALGPAPSPKAQLDQMRANIAPKRGEYWVAAGISFTSFVLISGEIVVTVAFGDGLEITVLGLARVELPVPGAALVSIELALLARFSTKEGTLLVQAQLTENSWLLMPAVRLTGGFAMATWWKGDNAGQFVVTMGGYHPKFHHPGYPTVPRLGIRWQPVEYISVIGETYFALCSEALMAGTKFEVSAHFGPAHAKLSFGADGIVFFDPFWFDVSAWAEISAGIRIWVLFGTIDVELSLGAYIEVTGPPIHIVGHFDVCGFEVPFEIGDEGNPADRALNAADFRDKYLRASSDAQVIQSSLVRGSVAAGRSSDGSQQKVPDGSAANPYRVVPEFELMLITTVPAVDMALTHAPGAPKSLHSSAPELGVAPMYSHDLSSNFHADLTKPGSAPGEITLDRVTVAARPPAAFPKGVWGQAPNPKAKKVPAGETIDAADGFTMSTVLGELVGAPPIDYHQVEIPLNGKKGRKPLPFVTNTVNTNARVTASNALKTLAAAVRPDDGDLGERFNVAARVLEAGGYGALGVASMRGDRAAPPRFGSLADDLVKAPSVVSSKIKGEVVLPRDRTKRFVAPMVKAVLGAPLTIATSATIRTSVKDAGRAITRPAPTIDSMRADALSTGPASLITQSRLVPSSDKRTVIAGGAPPVTRLATSASAAIANARPDRAAVDRINAMTASLPNGTTMHEGEVVVVTVASRPTGDRLDTLMVQGGPTRVIALASGGNVLFDDVVNGDVTAGPVEIPAKTERVVIAAPGALTNVGGSLDGWYAGQSLPLVGWDLALAAGAVVRFANNRVADHRERADGGWADTRELARAGQVTTRFDRPVRSVAVAIDDAALAGLPDAASRVVVRLRGAVRAVDAAGDVLPPRILVAGIRTILVYDIEPQPLPEDRDPNVAVIVDNTRQGDLAGVAATTGDSDQLLRIIATAGFDAAVAAPLPGGLGQRVFRWQAAEAPVAVKKAPPKKKAAAKKAPAKKSARKRG